MKDFIKNPLNLNKIEFWAATTLYVFAVFFLVATASNSGLDEQWSPYKWGFKEFNAQYTFYSNYFFPQIGKYTIYYAGFLLFNFYVAPRIIKKEELIPTILLVVATIFAIGLALGITDTYLKGFLLVKYKTLQEAYNYIFQSSFAYTFWIVMMFGMYSVIKYTAQYLLLNSEFIQSKYQIISHEGLIAFVLWMISIFLLLISNADQGVIAVWAVIIPFGIGLYWYSFYNLIPKVITKKKPFLRYIFNVLLISLIAILPISLLALIIYNRGNDMAAIINLFNVGFQLLFTAPLAWAIYKKRMAGDQELYILKTELGRSHANFDFLRSQINPHFLFNALNTLYGTAIQEKADRTSEGIQRLGDMMRFMLQENMQEKISLTREVEYLQNYITLQKLRTDTSPEVIIQTEIEEQVSNAQISPMLLIPFVENAFKHGISLREPSHIKITLQTKENTLYFDVHNSIHPKPENDPEKTKSGIGLTNVKQRLRLLYPNKHELIIRETGKEFFIHLTLQLV
ncbi:MAG TPA: histidine kinase [Sphingobacteriaceae bacterium]|nr:histidine kinase [Sphingobacteriaceae bacterium]